MTRLVIAGAGGFGRGVFSWVVSSPAHVESSGIKNVVFIDDRTPTELPQGSEIVSRISDYQPLDSDRVLCAIGDPAIRKSIVEKLASRGTLFHTFVDDRAVLGSGVSVEEGTIVCPGSVISAHAKIARHVHINFNCSIGHDTVLEPYCTLSPMANVMGESVIGEQSFLGGSSTVLPRLTVGANAVVGAGSTVISSVARGSTVVGSPARRVIRKEGK